MMKLHVLLFFLVIAVFTLSFSCSSAQNIDVSNMDNAQLLELLQAIMQKLETEGSEAGTVKETPGSPVGTAKTGEAPIELDKFQIYENKKLILERLPDWYFVQKNKDGGNDDGDNNNPSDPGMTLEECEKACWDMCGFDMGCFTLCYYPKCEPVPDWAKDAGLF